MKSDKNLIFADIVYFGLIYPPEGKFKQEKKATFSNQNHKPLNFVRLKYLPYTLHISTIIENSSTISETMFGTILETIW